MILERIHTDVCGPFSVASTAKHRYYVNFVDDFSRKCWILFMLKKSKTHSKFYEFKALVEKESGKKVKALRSDNGGETSLTISRISARKKGSEESSWLPITHSRTGFLSRRTERLWVLHGQCCMIRVYPFTCGRKHAI